MDIAGKLPPKILRESLPPSWPQPTYGVLAARDPKRDLHAACRRLAFGELKTLTSALLAVFLPLAFPCVAREKPELLEPGTQLRVELHQRPGDSQTHRARLAVYSAAVRENQNIELVGRLGGKQRLLHRPPRRLGGTLIPAR